MTKGRLELARRQVEHGRNIIERQQALIARKHAHGHDAAISESLLAVFKHTQDIFEQDLLAIMKRG